MLRALFALTLVAFAAGGAVEVTDDNYESVIFGGKNAFVKFLAPWCGHCKKMKPAWDQLGDEYKGSSVVIADADCTVHKAVCEKFSVRGYPTIKSFIDGDKEGKDYSGGRDYDSLKKHVDDNLVLKCQVDDPSGCDEREQKYIEKMKAKGAADINKQLDRLQGMTGKSMKADLKQWLFARINILQQLKNSGAGAKEEL